MSMSQNQNGRRRWSSATEILADREVKLPAARQARKARRQQDRVPE
jgi:hypothetical protein